MQVSEEESINGHDIGAYFEGIARYVLHYQ